MNNIVFNKISLLLLIITAVLAGFYLGVKVFFIMMPFIIAWVIAKILQPVVFLLHKKLRIHRSIATLLAVFLFLTLGGFLIYQLGNFLLTGLINLSAGLPELTETIKAQLLELNSQLYKWLAKLPIEIPLDVNAAVENLISSFGSKVGDFVGFLINKIQVIPKLFVMVIITFVASYFMTKDRELIKETIQPLFDSKIFKNKFMGIIRRDVFFVLGAYLKAQLILMSLTFVETSIGLTIIGVQHSIFIALGISLLDALPIFGTGAVFIPWILTKLVLGNYKMALYLLIVYLVATLGRQSLEPKILSTQIGVHPLITLLSIYLGVSFLGVIGIILGPLTIISLFAIYKAHFPEGLKHEHLNRE